MWLPVGIIDQSLGSACFPVCKILAHFESEVSHGIIHVHSRLKCYSNTWAQAAIYCHHITAKGSVRIGWLTGTKYDNMKAILIQILFFHEQVHQARLLQKKKKKKLINWKKKEKIPPPGSVQCSCSDKKKNTVAELRLRPSILLVCWIPLPTQANSLNGKDAHQPGRLIPSMHCFFLNDMEQCKPNRWLPYQVLHWWIDQRGPIQLF